MNYENTLGSTLNDFLKRSIPTDELDSGAISNAPSHAPKRRKVTAPEEHSIKKGPTLPNPLLHKSAEERENSALQKKLGCA
jgi:hypothetical protein